MEPQMARRKKVLQPGFEGKREMAPDTVESPYARGEYDPVIKNVRESSLSAMYAKRQIDAAQLRAGEWFRAVYERTRMGCMAVDPSREPVDISGHADPIPDRIIAANQDLAAARLELGAKGYLIVEKICGQGFSISEIARPFESARGLGWLLRISLDALAEWKGYASRKR